MKKTLSAILLLLSVCISKAQTKIFKEISADIQSQVKAIRQDNALVGYMVFTQLEKASADSFNYKITIMDENLNDIGTVKFKEQKLFLQDVSFEQDVLCIAYQKSNFVGYEFKNKRECRNALPNGKTSILVQFISLDGKIIKSNTLKADVTHEMQVGSSRPKRYYGIGRLKYNVLLRNIPGKGFACFYGDDNKKNLLVLNPSGNQLWKKTITQDANSFWLLTTAEDVYMLSQKQQLGDGEYQLLAYSVSDSSAHLKYDLKDKQGNSLKVITFDYDPATQKPFISGYVIDPKKGSKGITRGKYSGVFTTNLNGHDKGDINGVYSYWADGSQPRISYKGRLQDTKSYVTYTTSFKDFEGNTWYTGSPFVQKTRVGGIIVSVVLAPFVYPTLLEMAMGYTKIKIINPVFLKQNAKGNLALENVVLPSKLDASNGRNYYFVSNSERKTLYTIVDGIKNFYIYDLTQKKVIRTIPHNDGSTHTNIFPAKEGHVMISEYNEKDRYTRVSIEAL